MERESGWSTGMKLEFYPSNPGLTPTQVKPQKVQKPPSVPLMTANHKAYKKMLPISVEFLTLCFDFNDFNLTVPSSRNFLIDFLNSELT